MQAQAKSKKKRTIWIILSIVIVVLVIAGAALVMIGRARARMSATLNAGGGTQTVQIGNIEVITEGSGSAETANTQDITVDYDSKVSSLEVSDGDTVTKGQVLARLTSDALDEHITDLESQITQLDSQIKRTAKSGSSTISSMVAGRVKRIYVKDGDSVSAAMEQYKGLMEIAADGKLQVKIPSSSDAAVNQAVTVTGDGWEEDGFIESIDKEGVATVVIPDREDALLDSQVSVSIEGTPLGSGTLQSHYPITILGTNGTVDSIKVDLGQKVSSGTTLMKLSDVDYSAQYLSLLAQREDLANQHEEAVGQRQALVITASQNGIVTDLTAQEGDMLKADTALCSIVGTDSYQVKIDIDEMDIAKVAVGQSATVTFDAIEDKQFTGTVSKVSLLGVSENGMASYTATILLDDTDGILPAMSANAKIVIGSAQNVLLVPIDAIQSVDGKDLVAVVQADGTNKLTPVTLGLVNDSYAEVKEGLSEGDEVVTISRSSGNTLQNFMGFGGTRVGSSGVYTGGNRPNNRTDGQQ